MKLTLQIQLGQHLTMTPQLQQAIRLLQLSTLELHTEVQQALEANVMLEQVDDTQSVPEGSNGNTKTPEAEIEVQPADIPSELAVDSAWDDIYDGAAAVYRSSFDNAGEFEGQHGDSETLKEHLRWQMELTNFSDEDVAIAQSLIDAVDDDGYLRTSAEEIAQVVGLDDSEIGIEEVEAVLHQIQNFDPIGVGARDLRECLLIQLRQTDSGIAWRDEALELVDEHLDLLAGHEYKQLMRQMNLDKDELMQVIAYIQALHPRPGTKVSVDEPQYIIPDVFVRKKNGAWTVELNADASPKVRINPDYASLVRRADNSDDNNYLRAHLQEARWFLKSLRSRSETLLKVSRCIVERQQLFLEHGEEAMKPMVLHDVADVVGMHESTISRVTTQKYMHTPRGIYELKYFFSSHVSTASGGEASSTAIRALIKKLIAAENSQKPLSDSKLAAILLAQGVNVARRTVAKYREGMGIASSSDRKRLA